MWKIALIVWIMVGTTVAGIAFLIVLATPSLAAQAAKLTPYAISIGAVVGAFVSFYVAKQIAPKGV